MVFQSRGDSADSPRRQPSPTGRCLLPLAAQPDRAPVPRAFAVALLWPPCRKRCTRVFSSHLPARRPQGHPAICSSTSRRQEQRPPLRSAERLAPSSYPFFATAAAFRPVMNAGRPAFHPVLLTPGNDSDHWPVITCRRRLIRHSPVTRNCCVP